MNSKDKLYALFYKFIFLYEDKLKTYNTNKAVKKVIPSYNDEFIHLFSAFDYTEVKGGKAPQAINEEDCVYMTNNKTIALSFLTHFRHALCHATWKFEGNDKYIWFKNRKSAIGCVKTKFIFEILEKLLTNK